MASPNSIVCNWCQKSYTSSSRYKSHFHYPVNASCRIARDSNLPWAPRPLVGEAVDPLYPVNPSAESVLPQKRVYEEAFSEQQQDNFRVTYPEVLDDDDDAPVFGDNSAEDDDESFVTAASEFTRSSTDGSTSSTEGSTAKEPDRTIMDQFDQYVEWATNNTLDLDNNTEAGIALMHTLGNKRAPLNLYDAIYDWHMEHLDAKKSMSRKKLMTKLSKRYNMEDKAPKIKKATLPFSKITVSLVVHDMFQQIQSILTDPRIKPEDFLFFDGDPLKAPPEEFEVLGDYNTGRSFRKTREQLVTKHGQAVLPIMMYMDAAHTGEHGCLPIEALKFTLGILNAETRDKSYAWRNIGYVTSYFGEKTKGEEILEESEHIDAAYYLPVDSDCEEEDEEEAKNNGQVEENNGQVEENNEQEEEDNEEDDEVPACAAQDLHAMLAVFLEDYIEMEREKEGFLFKIPCRAGMPVVHWLPYIAFIKGDTQEAEKHCGKYLTKTGNVGNLCRYCVCPTAVSDNPYRTHQRKSPGMIQALIDDDDDEGLRNLSQQKLMNVWYQVKFGSHNEFGVHGACPVDLLHWLQIGKYKYKRECFFAQTGESSNLSKSINTLACMHGAMFERQSDRHLPRTNFQKGLRTGQLAGHEMRGMILVLLSVLRSSKGRDTLMYGCRGEQVQYFNKLEKIKKWIKLLETYLMMEEWLNRETVRVFHVLRFRTKMRELLQLEKEVLQRDTGMGHKLWNFHGSLHIADDMLDYGVCNVTNTQSNEGHHKPDKTCAKRTQRRPATFDWQCATRIHELDVINFAHEEVNAGIRPFDYYQRFEDIEEAEPKEQAVRQLTGAQWTFGKSNDEYSYRVHSRMQHPDKFKPCKALLDFLQKELESFEDESIILRIYTEHNRHGEIFRAAPYYLGKPWMDWAMITWTNDAGGQYELPGQLYGFLDLRSLPAGLPRDRGIYAIVESAAENKSRDEKFLGSLFVPLTKEPTVNEDGSLTRQFYLVDVDAIAAPACVIPDIGNEKAHALLRLKPRSEWGALFIDWLEKPHKRQFLEPEY